MATIFLQLKNTPFAACEAWSKVVKLGNHGYMTREEAKTAAFIVLILTKLISCIYEPLKALDVKVLTAVKYLNSLNVLMVVFPLNVVPIGRQSNRDYV